MRQLAKAYDPGVSVPGLLELDQHTTAARQYGNQVARILLPDEHMNTHSNISKSSDKEEKCRQIPGIRNGDGREAWRVNDTIHMTYSKSLCCSKHWFQHHQEIYLIKT